jgi:hypothetical protein
VRGEIGGWFRWGMPEDSEWVTTSNHRTGLTTLSPSLPQPRISITTPFSNPVPPACSQSARTSNGKCYRFTCTPSPPPPPLLPCIMASHANQNGGAGSWGPEHDFHSTHKLGTLQTTPYLRDSSPDIMHIRYILSADDVPHSLAPFCLPRTNASPLNFSALFFLDFQNCILFRDPTLIWHLVKTSTSLPSSLPSVPFINFTLWKT